jgi:hypothetical protein
MGYWKNRQIEEGEQGWHFIDDMFVCSKCFDDPTLSAIAHENAVASVCSYCGEERAAHHASELNLLLGAIADGLKSEWGQAIDELFREDGEYIGSTYSTSELFDHIGWPTENEKLQADLLRAFDDQFWCEASPFQLRPEEALAAGWEEFAKTVRERSRYLFLLRPDEDAKYRGREEIEPARMLDALGRALETAGLVKVLPPGQEIWRARVHAQNESVECARDLGPAPGAPYSNRMSPAGIEMFYGTFDAATASEEIRGQVDATRPIVTIGRFTLSGEMPVLDLVDLPEVPSLYDVDGRPRRAPLLFLRSFVRDISTPVKPEALEHVEYVPTQIVTEFVRDLLQPEGTRLLGLLYPSSRREGGTCVALFLRNEDCRDAAVKGAVTPHLLLDPSSIDHTRLV